MIIDLERQKRGLLDKQPFHFNTPGNDSYLAELGGKYLVNLDARGLVEKRDYYYRAHGRANTVLGLPCSRCLEEFRYVVDTGFQLNLVEAKYQEEFSLDEDVVFYGSDEVDIQPYIEELIFSEIPFIPLCQSECRGLCPDCGTNLNLAECRCKNENTDPRWDKLKNLKAGKEVT